MRGEKRAIREFGCLTPPAKFLIFRNIPCRPTQITSIYPPSRLTEGRLEIVTDARRDAVDADGAPDEGA
jgi:hypothetical protein